MERYLAGDHEDPLSRDVVLAPPTCCSSCSCSCTLVVPELLFGHLRVAAERVEAEGRGHPIYPGEMLWRFVVGVFLMNLVAYPFVAWSISGAPWASRFGGPLAVIGLLGALMVGFTFFIYAASWIEEIGRGGGLGIVPIAVAAALGFQVLIFLELAFASGFDGSFFWIPFVSLVATVALLARAGYRYARLMW